VSANANKEVPPRSEPQRREPLLIKCLTPADHCRKASFARAAQRKADWVAWLKLIGRASCSSCGWPVVDNTIFHAADFTSPEYSPRTLWQRSCDSRGKNEAWKVLNRTVTLCEYCHNFRHREYNAAKNK
jgi:hypothetical protein